MGRRVLIEVGLLALVAAALGALVSRVWLAPAAARIARDAADHAVAAAADEHQGEPGGLPPHDEFARAGMPENADASRDSQPVSGLAGRVSHAAGRYTIDLRGMRDPSALVAGLQLVPASNPPGGFVVRVVNSAAPLAAAGVRDGDVLAAINGRSTVDADHALAALAAAHDARTVTCVLQRGGREVAITVDVLR